MANIADLLQALLGQGQEVPKDVLNPKSPVPQPEGMGSEKSFVQMQGYWKGVEKALSKAGETHATEAVMTLGPQEVQKQFEQATGQGQVQGDEQLSILANLLQKPQGLKEQLFQQAGPTPEGKWKTGGVFNMRSPEEFAKIQEVAGEKPLQRGTLEQENVEYENQRKLQSQRILGDIQVKLSEQMAGTGTGSEAVNKKIREANSIMQDLDTIEDLFIDIPGRGGVVGATRTGLFEPFGGRLDTYKNAMAAISTKIGRFVGEDRFTEKDRKVFMNLFPTIMTLGRAQKGAGGKKEFTGDVRTKFAIVHATVKSSLNAALQEREGFSSRANFLMKAISDAKKEGYSDEEILQEVLRY